MNELENDLFLRIVEIRSLFEAQSSYISMMPKGDYIAICNIGTKLCDDLERKLNDFVCKEG